MQAQDSFFFFFFDVMLGKPQPQLIVCTVFSQTTALESHSIIFLSVDVEASRYGADLAGGES